MQKMNPTQKALTIDLAITLLDVLNDFSAPHLLRTEDADPHGSTLDVRFNHFGIGVILSEQALERIG